MPHRPFLLLFALVLARPGLVRGEALRTRITDADLFRIRQIESPALSPDGHEVVYVVRFIEPRPGVKGGWVYRTQLWLAAVDGETPPHLLSPGPADDSSPVWSPRGDRIAFVRAEGKSKPQIYLVSSGGGETSPLTEMPGGAFRPRWSPDGDRILFSSSSSSAQQDSPVPGLPLTRLYTILAQQNARPVAVSAGRDDFTGAEWLRGGHALVCAGPRQSSEQSGSSHWLDLYTVDVATGHSQVLLEEPGCSVAHPLPSPDGKWIAFELSPGGDPGFVQRLVAVIPAGGGKMETLTAGLDRSAGNLQWGPDSKEVYFTAPDRGHTPLFRVTLPGAPAQQLTVSSLWGVEAYSVVAGSLVQVVAQPADPSELYAGPADGRPPHPLTSENSTWLEGRQLSPYEPHSLVTNDGLIVDFWTLKPADFDPVKKYPLLVEIHGGPAVMWGPGTAAMWHELQYFAGCGYAVVFCNPRGSAGSGRDFRRANFRDWATGPMEDVLAAVDYAAHQPFIDRTREVITGRSDYGGYLTAWIVGHDHRFKAAAAQGGVYDLPAFYAEDRAGFLLPLYFGGLPWQPEIHRFLDWESPLASVESITTPLLLESDSPGSPSATVQALLLYKSLKELGRPVEYSGDPFAQESDCAVRPAELRERLVRIDDFFRRHIGGK